MLRIGTCLLLFCLGLSAADQPLGRIERIAGERVIVTFDADPGLAPDTVLAVFAPGELRKHPLTGEVITEHGDLVAKLLSLAIDGAQVESRLVWRQEGTELAAGFDVVPQPGEASPDAPPVRTAELPVISAPLQRGAIIALPITDPEGAALRCSWRLDGPRGASGRLSAATTAQPVIEWLAPGVAGETRVICTARDRLGQESVFSVTCRSLAEADARPANGLRPHLRWGGHRGLSSVARAGDGSWWGVANREIVVLDPGWRREQVLPVSREAEVRSPLVVQPHNDRLYVLDESARSVVVLDRKGSSTGRIGAFSQPSDLVVAADGTVFVADQGLGGVVVFEADGRYRCRLGEPGSDPGTFRGLAALTRDRDGTVYALDRQLGQIQRWDRLHRRLPDWDLQLEERVVAVDLAVFRNRVLVLLEDGRILRCDDLGRGQAFAATAVESGLVDRLGDAARLATDAYGRVIVSYPRDGILARYDEAGRCTGVRGASLWQFTAMAADGAGMLYAADSDARIAAFDPEGWLVARFGGSERDGGPFAASPSALACQPDGSALLAIDERNYAVVRFDLTKPDRPWQRYGKRGSNNGEFEEPVAVTVDEAGRIYVADQDNHNVSVLAADGTFLYRFGRYERGRDADELARTELIAVAPDGGTCYIYDSRHYEVQKFRIEGGNAVHVTNTGGRGNEEGRLSRPVGMACDRAGLLYIADSGRRVLQVVDFRGKSGQTLLEIDLREDLSIDRPTGLTVGPDGLPHIYERDTVTGLRW